MPRIDATPAFLAALDQPIIRPALFIEATFLTGTLYLWTGKGNIGWNGHTWTGVGGALSVSTIEEGDSVEARGITLGLSGLDPTLLADALNETQQGAPAIVYFGLFDATPALIPNPVVAFSGRMDAPTIDVDGQTAAISIACESRLVDMNTPAYRRYNNEDQQREYPNDTAFQFVPGIAEITLYWGRTPNHSNL